MPETQAKDVLIGQVAEVDTRNGIVQGKVARIDPAVQNGTVTVDIALTGELPKGARPDLTVDGTIELERLTDVVFVGRPAQGQPKSQISLFRLEADGVHASRVKVTLGREFGQHGRGARRPAAGRAGDPLGHLGLGRERSRAAQLTWRPPWLRSRPTPLWRSAAACWSPTTSTPSASRCACC